MARLYAANMEANISQSVADVSVKVDGLLHDANNTLLNGWVREKVGSPLGSILGRGRVAM